MLANFHIAYTLDVLAYIDIVLDAAKRELYEEDVMRFMPMLGTVSDKHLEKLIKMNKKSPGFIWHILPMLMANDHLDDWKTEDLLDRHKRLVTVFKQSKHAAHATKSMKRFIKGDYLKAMPRIKVLVTDLERLGFKKFWLEEKLPTIKTRIGEFEANLGEFDVITFVNSWLFISKIMSGNPWYILAYGEENFKQFVGNYSVMSLQVEKELMNKKIINYGIDTSNYKKLVRELKPTDELKQEFKTHPEKKAFKNMPSYVEACFKMALKNHLITTCGNTKEVAFEEFPFALKLLDYLANNEKTTDIKEYISKMVKHFSK